MTPPALILDGERLDARVEEALHRCELVRTMEGASSLELDIIDTDRALLRSGILTRPGKKPKRTPEITKDRIGKAVLSLDGERFRLAGIRRHRDRPLLGLTFEDEIATLLRSHKRARKISRGQFTRAQFISLLCSTVKERKVILSTPDIDKRRRIERTETDPVKTGVKGFGNQRVLVRGARVATAAQKRNLTLGLRECDELAAPERATLAWIEAVLVEGPDAENPTYGHSSSVGILQLLDMHLGGSTSTRGGRRDVALVTRMFLTKGFTTGKGAIQLARENPDWTPGDIAAECQGPRSDLRGRYEAQRSVADAILAAWGGTSKVTTQRQRYEYSTKGADGKPENYWKAARRLAEEVRWRLWASEGVLRFWPDDDLIKAEATVTVNDEQPWVTGISWDMDIGRPVSEAEVDGLMLRWGADPGGVWILDGEGPADGRWLISTIRQDLLQEIPAVDGQPMHPSTVTLRRPQPQLPEPAAETRSSTISDTGEDSGEVTTSGGAKGIVDDVARLARSAGGSLVFVVSAYRNNSITSGGNRSDHASNDASQAARDIAVRGVDAITGPPHPSLDDAIVEIGKAFGRSYERGRRIVDTFQWQGFRIQVIWRTPEYGGHMGHIHVGARKL